MKMTRFSQRWNRGRAVGELQRLIARDALRRDLMEGVQFGEFDEGYDISAADDLMRRAAEEIDAMQDEINRLRAVEAKGSAE